MPEPDFYIDEFMKELNKPVEGFTKKDFLKKYGCKARNACYIIKHGIVDGTIEKVGERKEPGSNGVLHPVPVYRMKKKDKI